MAVSSKRLVADSAETWYISTGFRCDFFVKGSPEKWSGVVKMYQKEYERWMAADLEDPDLKPELSRIERKRR